MSQSASVHGATEVFVMTSITCTPEIDANGAKGESPAPLDSPPPPRKAHRRRRDGTKGGRGWIWERAAGPPTCSAVPKVDQSMQIILDGSAAMSLRKVWWPSRNSSRYATGIDDSQSRERLAIRALQISGLACNTTERCGHGSLDSDCSRSCM